jgi:hypothetical protein
MKCWGQMFDQQGVTLVYQPAQALRPQGTETIRSQGSKASRAVTVCICHTYQQVQCRTSHHIYVCKVTQPTYERSSSHNYVKYLTTLMQS